MGRAPDEPTSRRAPEVVMKEKLERAAVCAALLCIILLGNGCLGGACLERPEAGCASPGIVGAGAAGEAGRRAPGPGASGSPGATADDEGSNPEGAGASLEIYAYHVKDGASDDLSQRSYLGYSSCIDTVISFRYGVTWDGRLAGRPDEELIRTARGRGTAVMMLVHNLSNGSFSRPLAHRVLSSEARRRALVRDIAEECRAQGYDGVNLDFEYMSPADAAGYGALVGELAAVLRPEGRLVAVCVAARTPSDPTNEWSAAFDYNALGRAADRVIVMAYDEHYPAGRPGPVASIDWVRGVLQYTLERVPADKLVLGVAAYGYDWVESTGAARPLPAWKAIALAAERGAEMEWDDDAQVPCFRYWNGREAHIVYFESGHSLRRKLSLARRSGLAGVAVWRLGYEDPTAWEAIRRYSR